MLFRSCSLSAMTVFLGNGDGTFGTGVNYVSGATAATSVAVGDLNGDGNLDMVVTSTGVSHAGNGNGAPGILLGKGDGTFQPVVFTSGAGRAKSVVIADFDGDSNLDLAVGGRSAQICLGKGDGTFQPPVNYAVGDVTAIVAGDFDGDGKLDFGVLTTTGLFNSALGYGDGTFQAALAFSQGSGRVTLVDFNKDGNLDVAIPGSVLLGNGDGTFQPPTNNGGNGGGSFSSAMRAADLNGDKNFDVIVGNSSNIETALGNGDGTFQQAMTFFAGGVGSHSRRLQ